MGIENPFRRKIKDSREGRQRTGGHELGGARRPGSEIDPAEVARRVKAQIAQMNESGPIPGSPDAAKIKANDHATLAAQRRKMGLNPEQHK